MRWILFTLSAAMFLTSLLTIVRAPDYQWTWKLAILAGEFGHWLVLLPLGLCLVAVLGLTGAWRLATLTLAGLAVVGFLRPAFSAWRIGRSLGDGAFSFVRLYLHPDVKAVAVRTEIFARPEGQELKLDFYPAAGGAAGANPPGCIVVIHGGGWDDGDRTQLSDWNPRFAARGWAVAALSYRLAPRFTWPAQRDDVLAAIAWLKAHARELGFDPQRFVLLGRSAGGQLATAVGYGARDPAIRGIIAFYAPHDMEFAWSVSREDDAINSLKLMRQYFGGPPDTPERIALYRSGSGQLLATRDSPPILLVHGVPDTLTWYRHGERLAAHLRALGARCEYLRLPWATHGFDFNPNGPGGQLADFAIERLLREAAQ